MRREVDKLVAAQFLESTKGVLDHLSRWKTQLTERAKEAPAGLATVYGKVRRLRDYLQRCVAAYPSPVQLDLNDEDDNLLVSCAVHELGVVDLELQAAGVHTPASERAWLEEKRRSLSQWALRLATRPVERIPAPDAIRLNTASARAVVTAILRNTVDQPPLGAVPTSVFENVDSLGPAPAAAGTGAQYEMPAPPAHPPPPPQAFAPAPGHGAFAGYQPDAAAMDAALAPQPEEQSLLATAPYAQAPPRGGFHGRQAAALPAGALPGAFVPPPAAEAGAFIDARRLRDPRLRAILALDLRAFERARSAQDHRLAMVHLASILEGVVIDYCLPLHAALGLKGPPDGWRVEEILLHVLRDRLSAMDRAYLFQVIAGRNLIRPSIQLQAPMVVTAATLEQTVTFVQRVFVELGFAGAVDPPPGGKAWRGAAVAVAADAAPDMPGVPSGPGGAGLAGARGVPQWGGRQRDGAAPT